MPGSLRNHWLRWSYFADCHSFALESAAACARVRRLPKDMCIFNQGDDSVRAHAIIEGSVRIAQSGSDGAQVVIRFIGPAEMFGTVALFTDGPLSGRRHHARRDPGSELERGRAVGADDRTIRRSPSTSSVSSASACRRCKTECASSPRSAQSGASPMRCCGSRAKPDTAPSMARRSSSRCGEKIWLTSPARRFIPPAAS